MQPTEGYQAGKLTGSGRVRTHDHLIRKLRGYTFDHRQSARDSQVSGHCFYNPVF